MPTKLTAAQMALMSDLLDQALPLDLEARQRWLQALAPEFADLAPALRQALLGKTTGVVDPDPLDRLPHLSGGPATVTHALKPGERVGPYELVRELGSGGMAVVWLARRADGAFRRELALKLPMLSRLRSDLALRFVRERDILASLEHPHIARLYDAGISTDGLPYLALEYVEGRTIGQWCDEHRLGIAERLGLFLQVLDAVQYAHGRQIIHRDLKPSNILVNADGQVQLLDFGVAKLITEGEAATDPALTARFGQALTPEYASPESLSGAPAGVTSDIYALGVVLYELLTGGRPYRLGSGVSIVQLAQALVNARIEPPSKTVSEEAAQARSTSQELLAKRLRTGLDAIVLKALARDPAQRYPSAAALAVDLQGVLRGGAADATRPGRKRWPSWMAGVGVLLVVAGGLAAWRWPANLSPPAAAISQAAPQATAKPSIAVLPFDNMSQDPEQGYFADGITEDLITDLSKVTGLFVIARNSTFVYKGRARDVREIAKALGVRYVLEGSVRKSGGEVRVNTQLVDGTTGGHLWADRFDGDLKNLFGLQDTVTRQVVKALSIELTRDDSERVTRRGTENVQAYDLFLKGWERYLRQTPDDFRAAIVEFKKAAAIDPGYGRAHAALAAIYWESYTRYWSPALGIGPRNAEGLYQAQQSLDQAMRAPTPLAHQVASAMLLHAQQQQDAIVEAKLAVASDPNDAGGYVALAGALSFTGKTSEAMEAIEQAMRLNPHYPSSYIYQRGLAQFGANQLSEAAASLEKATAMNSADYWSQRLLLATYGLLGRRKDAAKLIEVMKKGDQRGWTALFDPLTISAISYWYPFSGADQTRRFAEGLRRAGVPE